MSAGQQVSAVEHMLYRKTFGCSNFKHKYSLERTAEIERPRQDWEQCLVIVYKIGDAGGDRRTSVAVAEISPSKCPRDARRATRQQMKIARIDEAARWDSPSQPAAIALRELLCTCLARVTWSYWARNPVESHPEFGVIVTYPRGCAKTSKPCDPCGLGSCLAERGVDELIGAIPGSGDGFLSGHGMGLGFSCRRQTEQHCRPNARQTSSFLDLMPRWIHIISLLHNLDRSMRLIPGNESSQRRTISRPRLNGKTGDLHIPHVMGVAPVRDC
jgi:hypothetical protein